MSSMPPVVGMTLAPDARIFWILSLVMSDALCLIWLSFSGSLMMTWTPIFILVFCRLKSRQAILAFTIRFTIPCAPTVQFSAYPLTRKLSLWLRPWAFSTFTELMGYLATPLLSTNFTAMAASTTMFAKKSASTPMIFEDMEVLAALIRHSLPRS